MRRDFGRGTLDVRCTRAHVYKDHVSTETDHNEAMVESESLA